MKTWQHSLLITFALAVCASANAIGKNETESEVALSPIGAVKLARDEVFEKNDTEVALSPIGAVKLGHKIGNRLEKSKLYQGDGITHLPSKPNSTAFDEKSNMQQAKRGGHRSRPNSKKRRKNVRTSVSKLKEDPSVDEVKNNELVTSGEMPGKNIDDATCTAFRSKKRKRSQMEIAVAEIRQKSLRKREHENDQVEEGGVLEISQQHEKPEEKIDEKIETKLDEEKQDGNSTILEAPKKAKLTYRQFLEWRLSKLNRPQGVNFNRTKDDKVSAESADEQKANEVGVKHEMKKQNETIRAEKEEKENEKQSTTVEKKQSLLAQLVKATQKK